MLHKGRLGHNREPSVVANVSTAQNQQSQSAGVTGALRVCLLGPIEVSVDGAPVKLASKRARALLGYLVLRAGTEVPRSLLAGLLWGERSEIQARASLRQTLSELRGALAASAKDPIRAGKEAVAWDRDAAWIDVRVLEAAASSTDDSSLALAAPVFRGDLMEGLSIDAAAFEQWLAGERERFRLAACSVYLRLMQRAEQDGRVEEAIAYGQKLLSIDPLQEQVHRALMRFYAAQGRYDAALAQYERCRRELSEQIGVRPQPETDDLVRSLRLKRQGRAAEAGGNPQIRIEAEDRKQPELPDRSSVAVLPFTTIGSDQESGYFAEGVADDIITELSRNKDLFVVARHSSFQAAQENNAYDTIGRALGVRHVLTGSVRRAGDRLRLSAHLIECETGSEAWAERYDRRLADVFEVQLDVARTVTSTIAGRLTALAGQASAAKPPDNFDAYDHVLRAQHLLQHYARADYARARQHLEKAIEADPGYARAYSLLCIAGLYDWFWEMTEGGLADVLTTGETALSLDNQDAKTHLALAVAQLFLHRHDRAIHHFERAIALNPNDDLVLAEHGRLLMYLDRPDDGLARVREAMRLNPYHPNWYWNLEGRCLHTAARYDEAIAAFERIDVPQFWIEAYLAACHAMCGRDERAGHYAGRLMKMRPDFRLNTFRRLLPYRNPDTLERFLDTLRKAGIED